MSLPLSLVDAFTDRAFAGNPAGVCVLEKDLDPAFLAAVAQEMNQAETAFLLARDDGWGLRWFTPEVEVDLCGHATLASAHLLWETGRAPGDAPIRFHTRSGLLTARREGRAIVLDFPATPPVAGEVPASLAPALGVPQDAFAYTGRTPFDLFVELGSEAAVRALEPDLNALGRVPARGIVVTALSGSGSNPDFVSRFFAPGCGVPEDPVTGSLNASLAHWLMQTGVAPERYLASQGTRLGRQGRVRIWREGGAIWVGGRVAACISGTVRLAGTPRPE